MLMMGATAGDLVQFVKTSAGSGGRNKGRNAAANRAAADEVRAVAASWRTPVREAQRSDLE